MKFHWITVSYRYKTVQLIIANIAQLPSDLLHPLYFTFHILGTLKWKFSTIKKQDTSKTFLSKQIGKLCLTFQYWVKATSYNPSIKAQGLLLPLSLDDEDRETKASEERELCVSKDLCIDIDCLGWVVGWLEGAELLLLIASQTKKSRKH